MTIVRQCMVCSKSEHESEWVDRVVTESNVTTTLCPTCHSLISRVRAAERGDGEEDVYLYDLGQAKIECILIKGLPPKNSGDLVGIITVHGSLHEVRFDELTPIQKKQASVG